MNKISLLIVGTGGYGSFYLKELLNSKRAERFQIVGAVDPYAASGEYYDELCSRKIPIYDTLEEFYKESTAQMAVVVTPIHLHAYQAQYCMEHGTDVLCEKPICAAIEDAKAMMETRDRTGRKLAIGFQWSYSSSILQLKQDILNGLYGKIKRIRTIVYFPRNLAYYERGTGWAGKRRLENGALLLDSVASNATAHYLHNMLFLTGKEIDKSAEPVTMEAEVYRINPIEMFDTCALRIWNEEHTELLFYATHAVPMNQNRMPEFILEGEKGTVTLTYESGQEIMTGMLKDGQKISYEAPSTDLYRKLFCMADAVTDNAPLSCVPETVMPHLRCINALAESFPKTPVIPEAYTCYDPKDRQYVVKGLDEVLEKCWQNGKLPYEEQIPWAIEPHNMIVR